MNLKFRPKYFFFHVECILFLPLYYRKSKHSMLLWVECSLQGGVSLCWCLTASLGAVLTDDHILAAVMLVIFSSAVAALFSL